MHVAAPDTVGPTTTKRPASTLKSNAVLHVKVPAHQQSRYCPPRDVNAVDPHERIAPLAVNDVTYPAFTNFGSRLSSS
jgi:hypothetical protein